MKKAILLISSIILIPMIIVAVAGFIKFNFTDGGDVIVDEVTDEPIASKGVNLCFYSGAKTESGLYDISWLTMNIVDDKVTGEFQYIPAEKDSKTGEFKGTVGPVDKLDMSRTADVWWDTMAEGMNNREQLKIVFGEGNAQVAFGEMIDRGDGSYIYKDSNNITYGANMTDVDCTQIPMKIALVKIQGKTCYAYHRTATDEAPYAVDEYIKLNVAGDKITGTKSGTQKGPDMSNGYTGTISGNLMNDVMEVIFSYIIEGSKNKEKEIYKVTDKGILKQHYTLSEGKGILEPDTTKPLIDTLLYSKVSC